MIGEKIDVLDHGHIILLESMGSDKAIAEGARTSYQDGTKSSSDDRGLIRYLMRHRHTSPFHFGVMRFHIKLPIFVERQWARHRTGSWNEVSARYSVLPTEYYIPYEEDVRKQSKTNKQGRDEELPKDIVDDFLHNLNGSSCDSFGHYFDSLDNEITRELARCHLPMNTYTEKVWQMDLKNLLDFCSLRMDEHAQWEIRQYANVIGKTFIKALFPYTWEAFEDYRLNAVTLNGPEIDYLNAVAGEELSGRESSEFDVKMAKLGWKGFLDDK